MNFRCRDGDFEEEEVGVWDWASQEARGCVEASSILLQAIKVWRMLSRGAGHWAVGWCELQSPGEETPCGRPCMSGRVKNSTFRQTHRRLDEIMLIVNCDQSPVFWIGIRWFKKRSIMLNKNNKILHFSDFYNNLSFNWIILMKTSYNYQVI